MSVFLWVVVVALAVLLFCFTVYAFEVGGLGVLTGARFERCPRCGRHGLAAGGRLHPDGCPHRPHRQRLRHLWEACSGAVHLGHGHR